MVEKRVLSFLVQLREWLEQTPGNVVISCHTNSMRPIRRVFEHLSLDQMLQLESPQNRAIAYNLHLRKLHSEISKRRGSVEDWKGVIVPQQVKLATDSLNPLKKYY
jgi:bisphosphoglycerate-dependent phosphoglycerate mutase